METPRRANHVRRVAKGLATKVFLKEKKPPSSHWHPDVVSYMKPKDIFSGHLTVAWSKFTCFLGSWLGNLHRRCVLGWKLHLYSLHLKQDWLRNNSYGYSCVYAFSQHKIGEKQFLWICSMGWICVSPSLYAEALISIVMVFRGEIFGRY